MRLFLNLDGLYRILPSFHTPYLSLFLLFNTHSHTRTFHISHKHSHSNYLKNTYSFSLAHTHNSLPLYPSLSHTHSHANYLINTHTHTHTHTLFSHSNTHTLFHSLTLSRASLNCFEKRKYFFRSVSSHLSYPRDLSNHEPKT
jgi:hypothetical protein